MFWLSRSPDGTLRVNQHMRKGRWHHVTWALQTNNDSSHLGGTIHEFRNLSRLCGLATHNLDYEPCSFFSFDLCMYLDHLLYVTLLGPKLYLCISYTLVSKPIVVLQ